MQNINLSDLFASLFINRGWQTPTKNSHNHMYLINTGKFMTYYIFNLELYLYENLYGGKSHPP